MSKFVFLIAGVLALSSALVACRSGDEAVKAAENEVFAIHDEVMPRMSEMFTLNKQLRQRMASLDSLNATASGTTALRVAEEKEQILRLGRGLVSADSLMSKWMGEYNGDTLAKLSTDDALRYLAAQKEQITDVKTKFNTSIEQARQFLGTE